MSLDHAERVQVKFFVASGAPEAQSVIPVFHAWLRDKRVDDPTLVDVADYSHVHNGPGVLLVGHASDWYYDHGEGRPGMLFSRKRAFEGGFEARLEDAFRHGLKACAEFSKDTTAVFAANEVLVRVPDRLQVKNDDAGLAVASPVVESVAKKIFGSESKVSISREGSPRESLTLRIKVEGGPANLPS